MACPLCPTAGWFGGWIGGYFGIQPPQHQGAQLYSAFLTANLISVTVIFLKIFFDVPLCGKGGITLENVVRVLVKTSIMGIIYSIGINYLLNRYVFPPLKLNKQEDQSLDVDLENDPSPLDTCKCKKEEKK